MKVTKRYQVVKGSVKHSTPPITSILGCHHGMTVQADLADRRTKMRRLPIWRAFVAMAEQSTAPHSVLKLNDA
jgi:hypothetical protein